MKEAPPNVSSPEIMTPATLARGQASDLAPLFATERIRPSILQAVVTIILGAGSYGFTVGLWRGIEMAFFVAIKTPALLFITLLVTGLLNGILGLLLGTGIGFRQSILCQLLAFSLAAILLAALAPITFFLALEAPPMDSPEAGRAHSFYLLIHTALIGLGGFLAVTRLFELLKDFAPTFQAARVTLLSWLASNAFVGAQLSYLLRPFFGSPSLEIQFLRPDPFNGTFYEAVWNALSRLASPVGAFAILLIAILIVISILKRTLTANKSNQLHQ